MVVNQTEQDARCMKVRAQRSSHLQWWFKSFGLSNDLDSLLVN